MPKVAIDDGEIYYETAGTGHPLIFVSGLSGVGRFWQPQMAAFASCYQVVSYDQRGMGNSDRLQRVFSVDQMAAELAELMDALKIERAHIVGNSTGGAIGQTLAIEQPQRVASMVLASTWTHCDPWFRRLFEARRRMYQECGAALHAQFHPLWLYPPEYVNAHDAEIEEELRQSPTLATPVEVLVGRINAILAFDRRAGLSRIKTPTLVMVCDDDYITPRHHSEALARAIPRAKLVISRGGGHAFSKTNPEEFNRIVRDFLDAAG